MMSLSPMTRTEHTADETHIILDTVFFVCVCVSEIKVIIQ